MVPLKVPDMMCSNCVKRITKALDAEGMKFTVTLGSKTVALDEGAEKVPAAVAALKAAGYEAQQI